MPNIVTKCLLELLHLKMFVFAEAPPQSMQTFAQINAITKSLHSGGTVKLCNAGLDQIRKAEYDTKQYNIRLYLYFFYIMLYLLSGH